jgi:biotin carboxyl carrier protein
MKYKLNVNNQVYEVEIENINDRPVIVTVDGQRFEVTPERRKSDAKHDAEASVAKPNVQSPIQKPQPQAAPNGQHILVAPLPGTVIEVFVKPGEQVEAGQVVLVIEAMKMKNSIRSIFSGVVKQVLVSQGQSVAHKQGLVEFEE